MGRCAFPRPGSRRWPFLLLALFVLLAAPCAGRQGAQPAPDIASGPPAVVFPPGIEPGALAPARVLRVIDGDTIEVALGGATFKVRYIGIDTPETKHPTRGQEPFGMEAWERNRQLVEGKTVYLEKDVSETDRYGRLLRYVYADGRMVNAVLVAEGYAQVVTYPPDVKYADVFLKLQREARREGRGLWGYAARGVATGEAEGVCDYSGTDEPVIKGNISSSGERIYHVPGGAFYETTRIDEARGERWFCTEEEAVAAGWRRSLR